jgi:hypothetical protein
MGARRETSPVAILVRRGDDPRQGRNGDGLLAVRRSGDAALPSGDDPHAGPDDMLKGGVASGSVRSFGAA